MSTDVLAGGWAKALGGDRKQFNMFIEKMLDAFAYHKIVVDKAGKPVDYVFLEVNHAFEKMTGLKRERIIGKRVTEVLAGIEKDPADWIGVYGRVALMGEPVEFENHAEALGKWYRISAYCPERGYFVALFENISARKKAEYELWQAKKDWERTFDSVPDFVAILDNQYRIVRANRPMAQQLGVTPEKAIGLFCYHCVHELGNPPDFCPHSQTVKDGQEHQAEVHEPRLGGDFLVTTTPLRDEQGRMVGSVHVARNITEQKQREREIEGIARFPSENPNPIFRIDEKGTILYGNLAGDPLLTEWNSKIGERAPEHISRVASEALTSDKRVELEEKYGTKTFSLLFAPVLLEGYVNIYANDITERKKAEESIAFQANLLSRAREAIFGVDPKYNITFWNKGSEDLFGYTKEETMGKNFQELVPIKLENSSRVEELTKQEATGHWEGEVQYMRKDGSYVSVELNSATLKSPTGELLGVVTAARDITERKKAEEELKKAKEGLEVQVQQRASQLISERKRLFDILETVPIMVCLLTPDYHVAFANRSFREKFGESEGRHCYDYCFGKSNPCDFCESYKPLDTGIPYHWQVNGSDGSVIDAFDFPFTDVDGSKMILEMDIDITEQKRMEKQLKDAERLAAIGATAGMVGHDIRNPLQAIIGDLFLAKTDLALIPESGEKQTIQESLIEIEKNVDYINKIVQDLQDYARPLNPNAGEADLKLIIEKLLQKNGLPENVKVSVKVEDEARKIVADADYLNRILYNLVTNAVQAMPKGGKLTIHIFKEANDVLMTVKDTGVGIPQTVKGKLFTPMFTTKSKGQGFGLPVVKRMTESLGGTVSFESQEGKGTTFTVRLPPFKKLNGK